MKSVSTKRSKRDSYARLKEAVEKALRCPLCESVAEEPMTASDGFTYCKNCIAEHYTDHEGRSPMEPDTKLDLRFYPNRGAAELRQFLVATERADRQRRIVAILLHAVPAERERQLADRGVPEHTAQCLLLMAGAADRAAVPTLVPLVLQAAEAVAPPLSDPVGEFDRINGQLPADMRVETVQQEYAAAVAAATALHKQGSARLLEALGTETNPVKLAALAAELLQKTQALEVAAATLRETSSARLRNLWVVTAFANVVPVPTLPEV